MSREILGGGRSHSIELFPLDFEEYLYFSGRISNYGEDYEPSAEDVQNFYRMDGLPNDMAFIIDKGYMRSIFTDVEVARANYQYAIRDIFLSREQYESVIDVIAYTLNYQINRMRFGGTRLGLNPEQLSHIVSYLFYNGFLFADLKVDESEKQISDNILSDIRAIKSESELDYVLEKYTLSVISPLIYTRLMVDLEDIVGQICSNEDLYGKLYELTIKSEAVYKKGYDTYHDSYKYTNFPWEVDLVLWDALKGDILLEASTGHKSSKEHYVDKAFPDASMIRVLTDEPGIFKDTGVFYRIGYPKALLMLSNGNIYDLEKNKSRMP